MTDPAEHAPSPQATAEARFWSDARAAAERFGAVAADRPLTDTEVRVLQLLRDLAAPDDPAADLAAAFDPPPARA